MRRTGPAVTALAVSGLLACSSNDGATVAPDELVVGVMYADENVLVCPLGPAREYVYLEMDDEDDTRCGTDVGDFGSASWTVPAAVKPDPTGSCLSTREYTRLDFCRVQVAAGAFRPLTTDPARTDQFYAVLQFGDSCPEHALSITKRIVNEDVNNKNRPVPSEGPLLDPDLLAPNQFTGDRGGNYTELHFCYFRTAPSEAEVMHAFPDLGVSYAVFHDYEGPQPGWVLRKRWMHSDDSNQADPRNVYLAGASVGAAELEDFRRIVENPERPAAGGPADTVFDLARLR